MDQAELETALRQLDCLSREEYGASLSKVAAPTEGDELYRLARLGRLVGIIIKKPFATPRPLDPTDPTLSYTRAHRSWDFDLSAFGDEAAQNSWQYQTLTALGQDKHVIANAASQPRSAYDVAVDAGFERGFFWYLILACREYLCRDPELRREISKQVEDAKRAGLDINNVSPEVIVGSGGTAIGTALVQRIPILRFVGVSVIAGLVLIIYSIGLDAFCRWAYELDANPERE